MIPVAAQQGCPLVIAHRGGGGEAPENSMAAFQRLDELGVHHLETDAHVSADGVVVLSHDPVVDRTYDGSGAIIDMTWREISQLRNAAGERMPTLAEVLEAHPTAWFNIDAKSDEVVDPLLDVLDSHKAFGRVMLASFEVSRLERIRTAGYEGVSTSLGTAEVVRLLAAATTASNPASWWVPGPRRGVRAVQVPETWGPVHIVDRRFIAAAHERGLAVHVWTVNDASQMMRLVDLGVDGIVTDRPTMLRGLLEARGTWRPAPTPQD